jgi:hypothetical protein
MEFQKTGMTQMMDDNPGVTKMMDDKPKEAYFKCPSCGEMMTVEGKGDSDDQHADMQDKSPAKKQNAASMPMSSLRNKIVSGGTSNPAGMYQPPSAAPNLNSY